MSLVNSDSVLLLDKPLGMSSAQAVNKVKRLFGFKKAGHTGSLDPLATGLLPICFGQATKFSPYLLNADKTYYTEAVLGVKTTTADSEGDVIQTGTVPALDHNQLNALIDRFTGQITQIPSMFSALKHQGVPLYQLARQGITVERKARQITVYSIKIDAYHSDYTTLCLTVHCSKGTYIRNLVEDMGEYLGCGGHVGALRRLCAGHYKIDQAIDLEALSAMDMPARLACLKPVESILTPYSTVVLEKEAALALSQGKVVRCPTQQIETVESDLSSMRLVQLFDIDKKFIGLGELDPAGQLSAKRMMRTVN